MPQVSKSKKTNKAKITINDLVFTLYVRKGTKESELSDGVRNGDELIILESQSGSFKKGRSLFVQGTITKDMFLSNNYKEMRNNFIRGLYRESFNKFLEEIGYD